MKTYVFKDEIGYVELLDTLPRKGEYLYQDGTKISKLEKDIVDAARVSYTYRKKKEETLEGDLRLLKYLWDNKHMSPFEMVQLKFRVKAPLFISKQWMRHRTASYNEVSRRYTEENLEFFYPDEWRLQSNKNKQSSYGIVNIDKNLVKANTLACVDLYEYLLSKYVTREQARMVLPQNLYTEFIFSMNLRNLMNFLEQRDSEHAQYEIRVYAVAIKNILKELMPNFMEIANVL